MTSIISNEKDETLKLLQAALASTTTASQMVIPEGFSLENLEKLNPTRDSYRSSFSSGDYNDFVGYCKKQVKINAICSINADDMQASVIFDRGDTESPLHGKNNARLTMRKMTAFKLIERLNGEKLSQKRAAEIFEDNIDYFGFRDDEGNPITCSAICQRILKMKVQAEQSMSSEVQSFSSNQSSYEAIAVSSQEGPLPEIIYFTCEPYLGLAKREFDIRVSPSVSGKDVGITLSIINYEKNLEDIGQEFKEKLVSSFEDEEIETYVGSFTL